MWIPTTAALLLLGGAAASPLPAPQPQADAVPVSDVKAGFLALEDEYTDAYNARRTVISTVNSEYQRAYKADPETPRPKYPERIEGAYFPRFDRFAQAGSTAAQVWCLQNYTSEAPQVEKERDFTQRVMGVLMDPSASHGLLPRIVSSKATGRKGSLLSPSQGAALLTIIETVTSDQETKSGAAYSLASMSPVEGLSKDQKATMKLASMRNLVKRYPDTKYGKRASGFIFQTENLQIGMVAPDIVGSDVDGNGMKLSDFRGKVTVIDFWGFW